MVPHSGLGSGGVYTGGFASPAGAALGPPAGAALGPSAGAALAPPSAVADIVFLSPIAAPDGDFAEFYYRK